MLFWVGEVFVGVSGGYKGVDFFFISYISFFLV